MSWGQNTKDLPFLPTFKDALKLLKTARSVKTGKPLVSSYCRLMPVWEGEEVIAVQCIECKHPIITWHEDGRIVVKPRDDTSTVSRLGNLLRIGTRRRGIPAYNGRATMTDQVLYLEMARTNEKVVMCESFTIKADGYIDYDTVTPLQVEVIVDRKPGVAVAKKILAIKQQLKVRERLTDSVLNTTGMRKWEAQSALYKKQRNCAHPYEWLKDSIHKPLEDVKFEVMHSSLISSTMVADMTWKACRAAGATTKVAYKRPPLDGIAI